MPPQTGRPQVDFEPLHGHFANNNRDFQRQFFHLYNTRLAKLKEPASRAGQSAWGDAPVPLLAAKVDAKSTCVGTFYKRMKAKANFLTEYVKEVEKAAPKAMQEETNLVGADDYGEMEDETGRIKVELPAEQLGQLCTGLIIAIRGELLENGSFRVEDYRMIGLAPFAPSRPLRNPDGPVYLAIVSGLKFGHSSLNPQSLDLLSGFLSGSLGGSGLGEVAERVCRVIVAGSSIYPSKEEELSRTWISSHMLLEAELTHLPRLKEFDSMIQPVAEVVPVDIMPGQNDPANTFLPQQPFHPDLIPRARAAGASITTNPYSAQIGGRRVLGTSGQPSTNILSVTTYDTSLKAMNLMMQARHLAPTAPDTLAIHPYKEADPFVIQETPGLFFCGNQEQFESEWLPGADGEGCRMVAVPSFAETGSLVLVDLTSDTLEPREIRFAPLGGCDNNGPAPMQE